MPKAPPPALLTSPRRSARPKTISAAAERSAASEANLAQQERRAYKGKKKVGAANLAKASRSKAGQNLPPVAITITRKNATSTSATKRTQLGDLSNMNGGSSASQSRPTASMTSSRNRTTPTVPSGTRTGQPIPNYQPPARQVNTQLASPVVPAATMSNQHQPTETESEDENPAFHRLLAQHTRNRQRVEDSDDEMRPAPRAAAVARHETDRRLLFHDADEDIEEEVGLDDAMECEGGSEDGEDEVRAPSGDAMPPIPWDAEEDEEDLDGDGIAGDGDDEDSRDGDDNNIAIGCKSNDQPVRMKKKRKSAPKSGDFDPNTVILLNSALSFARSDTVLKNPYPDADQSIQMGIANWQLALDARPALRPAANVPFVQLTRRAIPQVRGQLKDRARNGGPESFGVDVRPYRTLFNQRRVAYLVESNRYIYEDIDQMQGPYYNNFGYKVTKTCFFNKASDDGVVHQDMFGPALSKQYIALLYTALRFCLDEWQTGNFKALKFTAAAYQPIYTEHLANLEALEAADPHFVSGLGEELYNDCMASFPAPGAPGSAASITRTSVENAVQYATQRRNQRRQECLAAAAAAQLAVPAAPF